MLSRKVNLEKLNLKIRNVEDILDLLAKLAQKQSSYFLLRPNLSDESDNMFIECAFASNSDYLITANVRDFTSGELKGFKFSVVTPGKFLKLWKSTQ